MVDIDRCEQLEFPQGVIYFGASSEEQSVGYLELLPKTSLEIHNRTNGIETMTQIRGKSSLVLYDTDDGRVITLDEGERFSIDPPGIWHIHANPFAEVSLNYWKFEGDIREGLEAIRRKYQTS